MNCKFLNACTAISSSTHNSLSRTGKTCTWSWIWYLVAIYDFILLKIANSAKNKPVYNFLHRILCCLYRTVAQLSAQQRDNSSRRKARKHCIWQKGLPQVDWLGSGENMEAIKFIRYIRDSWLHGSRSLVQMQPWSSRGLLCLGYHCVWMHFWIQAVFGTNKAVNSG